LEWLVATNEAGIIACAVSGSVTSEVIANVSLLFAAPLRTDTSDLFDALNARANEHLILPVVDTGNNGMREATSRLQIPIALPVAPARARELRWLQGKVRSTLVTQNKSFRWHTTAVRKYREWLKQHPDVYIPKWRDLQAEPLKRQFRTVRPGAETPVSHKPRRRIRIGGRNV